MCGGTWTGPSTGGAAEPGGHTPLAIADNAGIFLAGYSDEVRVFGLLDAQLLTGWSTHHGSVSAIAVTLDGRFAVSGHEDGDVLVWDVERQEPHEVCRHPIKVDAVALSADATWAAAVSRDEVSLWRLHIEDSLSALTDAKQMQQDFARCFGVSTDGRVFWPGPLTLEPIGLSALERGA